LKIYFVSQSIKKIGATGVTKVGFRMLSNFLDIHNDVSVLSSTSKNKFYQEFKDNYNLKNKPTGWYPLNYRFASTIGKREKIHLIVAKYILNFFRYELKNFIFQKNTIVFFNHITEDIYKIKAKNKNIKSVVIIHGSPDGYTPANSPLYSQKNVSDILNEFDYVVYLSKANFKSWTKKLVSNSNHFIISNSIEEDEVQSILNYDKNYYYSSLNFKEDNFNVVIPGSVIYVKGQDLIINNIEKILALIPNIHIHFIGGIRGEWATNLLDYVMNSKYINCMTFHGFVNNSLEFIYAADLILLPSRAEGQPLAVLEAMALGKVVVTTNYEGIEEVIDNEKSGFIIDLDNFDDLILDVLYQIYTNNEQKALIESEAKIKYIKDFSIAKQKEKIIILINEITRN
jgi:glycosyltransferase involved in cell wall biosynthesis